MEKPQISDKGDSFIKVLDHGFSNQLKIPHDFTKNLNTKLPHRVFIETYMTKRCWRVEVEEDGQGTTCLGDGWAAFVEAHCLEVGNILLFEHEEQSIFQVKIYDRNGCQKNLIVNSKESQPKPPKVIDIDEETLPPKKTVQETEGESFDCEPETSRKSLPRRTRAFSMRQESIRIIKKRHEISKKTVQRVCNVGEDKTSFSVFLAKEHQFSQLTVPKAVGLKKNLASKDEVLLQDATGNCRIVRLGHKKDGHALLCSGWKDFLIANNIVIGNTLNFDFVSDNLAQVHVTRSSEHVDHPNEAKRRRKDTNIFHTDCERDLPQDNYSTKDQTAEAFITTNEAESNDPKCSSFSIRWSKSRALTYLYIPKAVAREHKLKNKDNVALRDIDGKYWPLEVKTWNNGSVALTKGWSEFWEGLAIKYGDILKFEFVSHRRIQVSILKHERQHKINTENDSSDMEVTGIREPLLESTDDLEVMDIKGFDNDLLASTQDHCLLQTPPGFKPLKHHQL